MPPRPQPVNDEKESGTTGTLVSRNITIAGHRTSARLEPDMWAALAEICRRERLDKHNLCTMVAERKHPETSLTAAIRVFIMAYFRAAATEEGHVLAGHGQGNPFAEPRTTTAMAAGDQGSLRRGRRTVSPSSADAPSLKRGRRTAAKS